MSEVTRNLSQADGRIGADAGLLVVLGFGKVLEQLTVDIAV